MAILEVVVWARKNAELAVMAPVVPKLWSRFAVASGLAVAATMVTQVIRVTRTAPPEGPVRRFEAGVAYSWTQWLPCADGPNDALHNFTRPVGERPRHAWREPPQRQLCCTPPQQSFVGRGRGECFCAVIDDAISLPDPLPSPAASLTPIRLPPATGMPSVSPARDLRSDR